MDLFGALELDDLHGIRAALEAGADVNIVRDGMTPLLAAIDAEGDSHTQTGEPLHVDATALLLARGADPTLVPSGGMSPEQLASDYGHWLALELLRAHIQLRGDGHR